MNDKFIDDLLDQPIPDADENARKIALNAAMSEFSQGIQEPARPIDNKQSIWSYLMSILNNQNTGKVFATVAVAFVAVSVAFMLPEHNEQLDHSVVLPEPVLVPQEEAQANPPASVIGGNEALDDSSSDDEQESDSKDQLERTILAGETNIARQEAEAKRESFSAAEKPQELKQKKASNDAQVVRDRSITKEYKSAPLKNRAAKPAISPNASKVDQSLNAPIHSGFELLEEVVVSGNRVVEGKLVPEQRLDLNEEYAQHEENTIKLTQEEPVSTFSIDVDTASYSLVRNQIMNGYLPAPAAVRSEEIINYFNYDYPLPGSKKQPFEPSITVLDSPWNVGKKLVHIGIKGYDIEKANVPDSNLVFLLDVSGSMSSQNKLPLVKQSINLLLDTLKPTDTVSIVVYAGAAGTVLEPTKVKDKSKILAALQNLNAGGSTAGAQGIDLAYQLAEQNFAKDAVNRIILATDGDFNVGLQNNEALKTLVERKRDKGVFLSVLGFGRNNYQDDMMQTLAQNGNGVAAYIDSLSEAKKVLVDEATSTLFTIAKDVKIQVEFNAATVSEYRLVGYETRHLNREDFNNDKVDAGDIGAGHTVTAIYEITPVGSKGASVDELRYAENKQEKVLLSDSNEYGFLKIRYKLPDGNKSKLIEQAITKKSGEATKDIRFSIAAAGFAQKLKGGKNTGNISYDDIAKLARDNKGDDPFGYRSEFIQLVSMAKIAKP